MQVTDAPWRPYFCAGVRAGGTSTSITAADNGFAISLGTTAAGGAAALPTPSTISPGFTVLIQNMYGGGTCTVTSAAGAIRYQGGSTGTFTIPIGGSVILTMIPDNFGTHYYFASAGLGNWVLEADAVGHRFLGNPAGVGGSAAYFTGTVATALLDAVAGDSGSGGTQGVVPAPPAGSAAAGKYLSAAGTFTVPGPRVHALTDAATIATDASLADVFTVTLGGDRTLGAPTNPTNGQKAVWRVKQDGGAPRTLAYDGVFRFGTDVTSPTLSTTAGVIDYIGAIYNGTDSKWDVLAVVKGYA